MPADSEGQVSRINPPASSHDTRITRSQDRGRDETGPQSESCHGVAGEPEPAEGRATLYTGTMFGSHLSIAGSLAGALREAHGLHMDTVQVFTKNQQQWKVKPLDDAVIAEWRAEVSRLGWDKGCGRDSSSGRTVAHASYLINLASPDDALWAKSIDLMTIEIERCEALGIPYLVHHPGAYTTSSIEAGLARITSAYREIFGRTKGFQTISCLENTVGSGSNLGGPFEQLGRLRETIVEATGQPQRVGFCFDTCHAHAAGYDLSTRAAAETAMAAFDTACGLAHLHVMHLNDSKGACGSRLDRHEHIGEGTIGGTPSRLGESGFAEIVRHPALARIPKILETPKGESDDGTNLDTINLSRLRRLAAPNQPKATVQTPKRTRTRNR